MRTTAFIIFFLLGLVSTYPRKKDRALRPQHKTQAEEGLGIYTGKNTTIGKHPYLVGVLIEDEFWCAGAIISSNWVITIGDCVYGAEASTVQIVAGSSDGTSGSLYQASELIYHANFIYGTYDYDYTLIKVTTEFKWSDKIGNVSLPKREPKVNTALTIAGWGMYQVQNPGVLQEGTMYWQKRTVCDSFYSEFGPSLTGRMGCAYNQGKTTACSGDAGDPLVKNKVLYGLVVLFGDDYCSSTAWPVVTSNLHPVVSWIREYTGAEVAH